jgi:major membrane immunogen (membrane-anchored lipoprotein)
MTQVNSKTFVVLAATLLLAACASGEWTRSGFTDAQHQQAMQSCQSQAAQAERDYFAANARGGANTTTSLINNFKVRQRALAERNQTEANCLQTAGFTLSN